MVDRKNPWDPSAVDGSGTEGASAPDGGILFPDHSTFQFDATDPAAAASDWSDVTVDIDFVDEALTFVDTIAQQELNNSDTSAPPQDEAGNATNLGPAGLDWQVTPDYDDDPGWYPGWVPSSDQTAPRTDDGAAPASAAVTNSADETLTASLTLAEVSEQYPDVVWPANWWLL